MSELEQLKEKCLDALRVWRKSVIAWGETKPEDAPQNARIHAKRYKELGVAIDALLAYEEKQ